MLLPVIVSAVVGTVVGTFVSRWLDKRVPPPVAPPQQVIIVDPNKVNVGDFILIDAKEVFNPAFPIPGVDMVTPVRYKVTSLETGNDLELGVPSIIGRSADPREPTGFERIIPRSSVIRKTT